VSRLHPFDFAFGPVAEEWFGEIRSDGGRAARDPGVFAKLPAVEHIMAEMQTEEGNPEASEEYSRLLYVAYHFWEHGRETITVPNEILEEPSETPYTQHPTANTEVAYYFSLPKNLFWAQVSADEPHEPADGFFVVSTGREWVILVILGLREERQGFSQISLIATRKDMDGAYPTRIPPLAPVMPGGEAAGFHSIVSADDLLYLVRLALISTRQ
jgi:hypothetical protein